MQKELEKLRKELRGVMHVGGPRTGDFSNLASPKALSDSAPESPDGMDGYVPGSHFPCYGREEKGKPQRSLMDFEGGQDAGEGEGDAPAEPDEVQAPMKIIVDTREFNSSVVREQLLKRLLTKSAMTSTKNKSCPPWTIGRSSRERLLRLP